MLRNLKRLSFLVAAVLVCFFVTSFAQEGRLRERPQNPPAPEELTQAPPSPERREQLRRDIENMRIWKMTQFLELSTEQSTKFFPIFNDFQKEREKLEEERGEMMRRLGELVESEAEHESEIRRLMSGLVKNREGMVSRKDEFRREAGKVLSLKQQAKLVLFEEHFKREIRGMIEDIKMRRFRQGPHPPAAPPRERR